MPFGGWCVWHQLHRAQALAETQGHKATVWSQSGHCKLILQEFAPNHLDSSVLLTTPLPLSLPGTSAL